MFSVTNLGMLVLSFLSLTLSCADITLPGLNGEAYVVPGDITVGGLFSITDYGAGLRCTKRIRADTWVMEFVEAVAFAVQLVNRDETFLPNLTLGFAVLDYCRTTNTALARSLSFLPQLEAQTCSPQRNTLPASAAPVDHYDVIGVIGTFSSMPTVLVSYLYAVAKLPLLSFTATTDELSDKSNHPYFLRVVPPDTQQVTAMLTFISDNGWSFASILYEDNAYGEKAFENFKTLGPRFGICFASTQKINIRSDPDAIVKDLLRYPKARVVILFASVTFVTNVLKSSSVLAPRGHFIWIGSDGLSDKLIYKRELASEIVGSFVFMYYSRNVSEFSEYFMRLSVNSSENPWMSQFWEMNGDCSFHSGSCASYRTVSDLKDFKNSTSTSLVIDSVLTFAHAVKRLIEDTCPNVNKTEVRNCVRGELLLKYLLNTSFDGYTGRIKFNSQGDLMGKYEIRQVKAVGVMNETVPSSPVANGTMIEAAIAAFDVSSGNVTYNDRAISWGHLAEEDHAVNSSKSARARGPESVCSKPCAVGEYRFQLEISCCWECRRCRSNERVTEDGTSCETCEEFTWPNPASNLTTCLPIPLDYSSTLDTLPLIEISLAVIVILVQICVVIFYFIKRSNRVIKASSRELSYLQMAGVLLGYVTVIVFQTKPDHVTCGCLYFMYCLSFAWLYSPLIVKTIRIYRIFEYSTKHHQRPRFTSPQSQIIFSVLLVLIQVIICLAVYISYEPTAKISQPNLMEKYVELSCDMTLPGLASFLGYNILLVALCSYFAFKTRKLPENFNESLFISMCVSTTLIIWLSFIATYFTASRDYVRVLLLSMSLLLNHTVAIVFLFIPKIYAVMVVDPSKIVTNYNNAQTASQPPNFLSNRVTPISVLSLPKSSTSTH